MIPIMGDYDSYRHYIYSGGGLFNRADNMDLAVPPQEYSFMNRAKEQPFWNEETYGAEGEYMSSADISQIDYPIWPATDRMPAFMDWAVRKLTLTVLPKIKIHASERLWYSFLDVRSGVYQRYRAFFDHWLKDIDNDIMEEPPVDIQIRTGNGNYTGGMRRTGRCRARSTGNCT